MMGVARVISLPWKRKWELPRKVVRRRKGLRLRPTHFHPQLPLDMVLWGLLENKPTQTHPSHQTQTPRA